MTCINGRDINPADMTTATGYLPEDAPPADPALAALRSEPDATGRRVWWTLSFADDDGWRGTYITAAPTMAAALARATATGHNPGGEVLGIGARATAFPDGYLDRLLTDKDTVMGIPEPADLAPLDDDEGGDPC